MQHPAGLTLISSEDLKKLLAALHHGHLDYPLSIECLTRVGLQHCATELMSTLRQLDENGVRAVLVVALAERIKQEEERTGAAPA